MTADLASAAQARYRDRLRARVVPPFHRTGRHAPHALIDHETAESAYLAANPGDEPYREHLRAVGAEWGNNVMMRPGWGRG